AASDIYAPVAGEIVAFNEELESTPNLINESAFDTWIFKIKPDDAADVDKLLDAAGYEAIANGRLRPRPRGRDRLRGYFPVPEISFMSRALDPHTDFIARHIGPSDAEQQKMLAAVGCDSLDALLQEVVPPAIRSQAPLALPASRSEPDVLAELKAIAGRNRIYRNYIGQGYYGTHTPNVVLRNVLENPAWYTAYTPYQPEISQGRLEALLNYQTMVADLTGLDISNASLLDEGTAAAEAMTLARRGSRSASPVFFVSRHCHP